MQIALIGDLLLVAEGDLAAQKGDAYPGPVEEAATCGAWFIRRKPFPQGNRKIGYEVMRQMLEEAGYPWPRPDEDAAAIEKVIGAFEAGKISEAEFVDWVCLRVATA